MTPSEFRAWFDGFSEGIEGVPTLKQWERIKARVAEINGVPLTQTVFVERYWPSYYPRYWEQAQGLTGMQLSQHHVQNQCNANNGGLYAQALNQGQNLAQFNGEAAMREFGRKERDDLN